MRTCYVAMPLGIKRDVDGRELDFDFLYREVIQPAVQVCIPKTSSLCMPRRYRLSWQDDRAVLLRSGRPGVAIQVEGAG